MEEAAAADVGGAPGVRARPRAPATLLLGLLALAFSIVGWTSVGRDAFVIERRAFWGEPWRLLSAPLAHEHVVQLLAGMAGLWLFGREAERRLGTGRVLGICLLLALVTGLAEQAFDHGGTGITGIVYGLWALLLVGGLRQPALRGAAPVGASVLMVAAFFVSLLALPVSSWSHGAGALFGAFAGLCLDARPGFRQVFVPLTAFLLLLLGGGATEWRARWNFGGASVEYDSAGVAAFERGDEELAESELRRALQFDENNGHAWWNLGLVLARLGRDAEASEACWRAYEHERLDPQQSAYLEELQLWALNQHLAMGEAQQALVFATRVARLAPDDLEVWERVRELADSLGDDSWYDRADRECARLAPEVPTQPK